MTLYNIMTKNNKKNSKKYIKTNNQFIMSDLYNQSSDQNKLIFNFTGDAQNINTVTNLDIKTNNINNNDVIIQFDDVINNDSKNNDTMTNLDIKTNDIINNNVTNDKSDNIINDNVINDNVINNKSDNVINDNVINDNQNKDQNDKNDDINNNSSNYNVFTHLYNWYYNIK